MGKLIDDVVIAADRIAKALQSSGYAADFTVKSLKEVDRFFDEQTKNGQPIPTGLLGQKLGSRIFSLGSYVGEVIRRNAGGSWSADDSDPKGEINIELRLPNAITIWPVQRAMKRLKNGREDSIHHYAAVVIAESRGSPGH